MWVYEYPFESPLSESMHFLKLFAIAPAQGPTLTDHPTDMPRADFISLIPSLQQWVAHCRDEEGFGSQESLRGTFRNCDILNQR